MKLILGLIIGLFIGLASIALAEEVRTAVTVTDESMTLHYEWPEEMSAEVLLNDENALTSCYQECVFKYSK